MRTGIIPRSGSVLGMIELAVRYAGIVITLKEESACHRTIDRVISLPHSALLLNMDCVEEDLAFANLFEVMKAFLLGVKAQKYRIELKTFITFRTRKSAIAWNSIPMTSY